MADNATTDLARWYRHGHRGRCEPENSGATASDRVSDEDDRTLTTETRLVAGSPARASPTASAAAARNLPPRPATRRAGSSPRARTHTEALANVSKMVGDTADGIDERLGAEYGDYARRAAGAIEDVANTIAAKDPDELIDDTRNFVRNSPGSRSPAQLSSASSSPACSRAASPPNDDDDA